MNLNDIPVMASLARRMKWLNQSQRVISENIANADTPGFKPQTLEKQDFSQLVNNMTDTSAGRGSTGRGLHVPRVERLGSAFDAGDLPMTDAVMHESSRNGNAVVLEEEMLKLADTQMEYSLVTGLYKKNVGLLKAAMGKGGGR